MQQRSMRKKGIVFPMLITLMVGLALLTYETGIQAAEQKKMPEDRVMLMSKYSFNDTVSKIKRATEEQNMMVVFTADQQEMLKMVGLQTKGMLTIELFHPRYGKVIVQNDHNAALEVPLRIAVMEGDQGTMVAYKKPSKTFARYPKLKTLGTELDGVLAKITESVTK